MLFFNNDEGNITSSCLVKVVVVANNIHEP